MYKSFQALFYIDWR